VAELAAGSSKRLTDYLAVMQRFPKYSFGNVLLIATQRPDATHVAGFHAWKQLGRYVMKGEKGIAIVAPVISRKDDDEDPVKGFRVVHVFAYESTDGQPLPELAKISGDPGEATAKLRSFIASKGIELSYVDDLQGALGRSRGGKIEIRSGLSPAQEFEVLAHELAHELLHRKDGEVTAPLNVRELEAEAVAHACSLGVGLSSTASSADYIALYQATQKDAPQLLIASLDRIQNVSCEILREVGALPALAA
jgi:hypothetical protein